MDFSKADVKALVNVLEKSGISANISRTGQFDTM